ncbi:hypothetical protein JHK84_044527 [Glycine max]|nr:hypothetical protein JHK86_044417 [Glycine max]KAG5107620.1 hypothetical protein JHK84_044527 [Glycine max]
MVVQSLDDVVHQQLMVSATAEKSSESKIAVTANGGNGAKSAEKKLRELSEEGSTMPPRRSSARIQALQKAEEELLARKRAEGVEEKDNCNDEVKAGKAKKRNRKSSSDGEESVVVEVEVVSPPMKKGVAYRKGKVVDGVNGNVKVGEVNGKEGLENAGGGLGEKSDLLKVKETIRLFNKYYLHLVQEEEKRCGKAEAERKAAKKASKSKSLLSLNPKCNRPPCAALVNVFAWWKGAPPEESKTTAKRPDLKAMMENNEILYPEKRIGNIPGIDVGYQFYSRAEMVAVGFHSHWLNGIDYMGQSYAKAYSYELPVAVAIVISGMYEDDLDNAEDVVYTGQGGHNLTGDKRQFRDQKLERGNLALKNCSEQCVPVRVIRGHESSSSYTGKVYTYDGLYKVVNYWAGKGISGFTVYKFRLRRLEGQPTLTTNQVAKNVKLPMNATGCKCEGICNDPTSCACALRNGSDFPYVSRDGGRLIEAKDVVFECGPKCGCGPGCVNRTSQRGLRYRLEVFRTAKKGWAVRSWDFIPSGAPVCEYTGILARAEDMDSVLENNYIFEIDCLQTIKGLGGRERRSQDGEIPANLLDKYHDQCSESVPEFCIDAGSTGNIARFINHCCEPNLFVQCVLSTHDDLRLARIMLFAADNIPPLQELTYDYGYVLDSVLDSDGKIKQMPCYCGASVCRKRLF